MNIAVWLTHPSVTAWRFQPHHMARLQAALPQAAITQCSCRDELLEALPDSSVAIIWNFKQEWFYLAPKLRILATPAAGRDYVSVLPPEGIDQWYGSFHGEIMAETALGMVLGAHRGVLAAAEWMRSGEEPWPRAELEPLQRTTRGSHITILGLGNIGEAIARLAKPFGATLTGIRRARLDAPPDCFTPNDRLLPPADLSSVLPTTDTLICALPDTPETNQIIGQAELLALPAHAALINVGRGNAIDETALSTCLHGGHLSAACLDVFHDEPLPHDSPLRTTPRCYLMPHASAVAPHYLDLYLDELIPKLQSAASAPPRA